MARRTVAEVAEEARRRALPWAEVGAAVAAIDNPQLAYRKFLVEVEAAEGTATDVGFPYESARAPPPGSGWPSHGPPGTTSSRRPRSPGRRGRPPPIGASAWRRP